MAESGAVMRDVFYTHAVLEGTAREVGRLQAELLARNPEAAAFLTSPHPAKGPLGPRQAVEALAFFDRHCPGLNEEIAGFAEALGVLPEQVVYYAMTFDPVPFSPAGSCSHAAIMPWHSEDGHVRVIRNYEFSHRMSDLRLVTLRVQGRPAHLGFSEFLFGRDDGMNAHGLCVTMSAGAPLAPFEPGGGMFWALVRTVLDRCATVVEALEVIADFPLSFNLNLLAADATGDAALVEMASSRQAVRRIQSGEPFLAATNHFSLPEMRTWDLGRRRHSVQRLRALVDRLQGGRPTPGSMKALQAAPAGEGGLCAYDYTGFFGTLWAEIFDLTDRTVEVCFGPPSHNPWHTFGLMSPAGVAAYRASLPDTPAPADFWDRLEPGAEP